MSRVEPAKLSASLKDQLQKLASTAGITSINLNI